MTTYKRVEFKDLAGIDVANVDVFSVPADEVRIETKDGRVFIIDHIQDCCEDVWMTHGEDDLHRLVGRVVEEVDVVEEDCNQEVGDEVWYTDSATKTTITFKLADDAVVLRWFGQSNGYYSERVDIREVCQ